MGTLRHGTARDGGLLHNSAQIDRPSVLTENASVNPLTPRTIRRLGLLVAALTLTLAFSGLAAAQFHADRGPTRIPVLSYHGVTADPTVVHSTSLATYFDVRLEAFMEQMSYLRNAGYSAITAEQHRKWVQGEEVSLPEKPILITFDDGRRSARLATSVLRWNRLAATMYVSSGLANRNLGGPLGEEGWYLTRDDLEEMRSTGLWEVQFHAGPADRFEVHNPDDLSGFKEGLDSPRFER